jgi:glycosyltransferase involved in cell wall biosynthesis
LPTRTCGGSPLGSGDTTPVPSNPRQPRVLVVTSTSQPSGVASYVANVAAADPDLPVAYLAAAGSHLESALPNQALVLATGESREALRRSVATEAARFRAVLTHGARALLTARRAGVPRRSLRHVFHELPGSQGRRGWGEVGLALGVRAAACSPELAARMRRLGIRPPDVLPPVLGTPAPLSRAEARATLGLGDVDLAVGIVGRLDPVKRPELALEATARLAPELRDRVALVYVGDGEVADELKRRATAAGVAVRLVGSIPGANTLVRAFDAVAITCPRETFCLTLAEAALASVPVAAVTSMGARFLTDNGRLLPLADASAAPLAHALEAALTGQRQVDALGAHVAERFGPGSVAPHRSYIEGMLVASSTRRA